MAKKKAKKKRIRTTEWGIGQSIGSKKDDAQNAWDIVRHAIGEPLVSPKLTNIKKPKAKSKRQA